MIMLACEAFSADHSVDKSARDSVDSKGLYGRLRFPLMGFWWASDELHKIDYYLSNLVPRAFPLINGYIRESPGDEVAISH